MPNTIGGTRRSLRVGRSCYTAQGRERCIVFAQLLLRSAPMACLGGRSPYEVVTGLKPRLPRSIVGAVPVEMTTVDAYVKDLMEHLREVHTSVQRTTLETIEKDEASMAGFLSRELEIGDAGPTRWSEPTVDRSGPTRFQSRVYEGVYKIKPYYVRCK